MNHPITQNNPPETAIIPAQNVSQTLVTPPFNPVVTTAKRRDRELAIEKSGDAWRKAIKPKIRLMGRWLELAGFKPGQRARVICAAPGVIVLRVKVA
jgi:hypothetical protein